MSKLKIVFTGFMADKLMAMGEKFSHSRPDLKNPSKNVFVFYNSETFAENMNKIIKEDLESKGQIWEV